jgi:hypothetical protein
MRSRLFIVAALLLGAGTASGAEPTWQELQNLPSWASPVFGEQRFASTYALTTRINPYFLQGDFNGDGQLDVAVLVQLKRTMQQGIAILHAGSMTPIVVGAGKEIGNGGDDFSWLDAWSVSARDTRGKTAPGRGDALLVQKLESASGLIYWDGRAYQWRQQGD